MTIAEQAIAAVEELAERTVRAENVLATNHADLVLLVKELLDGTVPCSPGLGSVDLHVSAENLAALRRLTGSS